MSYVHKTMIVPAALALTVRQLASAFPSTAGMWTVGLSPTGQAPATHYISAGQVAAELALLLDSAEALAQATGIPLEQAEGILGQCVVDDRNYEEVLAELELVVVQDNFAQEA